MILIFWSFFLGVQSLDNEALLSNINTSQRFSSIDIYPQSFRLLEQTTFPIGLSPICIAYKNFPSSMPTSISMDEIAALLTLSPHVPSGWENISVGVPSAGSGAGYALLSSLAAYGASGGFVQGRDKGEYPSSVQTNPRVTIHSDVESVLKWFDSRQTPSITFLSNFVTIQRAISCLSVRVLIDVSPRILLTSISLNDTLQLARLAVDEYPLVSVLMYVAPRAQFCLPDNPIERLLGDTGITSNLITYGGNRFTPQTQYLVYKRIASYQCLSKPTLYGVGSSAIYPFIVNAFFDTLSKATSYLSYSPIGSGAGLTQLKSGAVLLAISDIPLSSSDQTDFPNLQMIPAVAFSVSIVYNLGDTVQLNIPACVVGDIFRGTVEYWDDDVLQRANPTAHLPHQRILVVVRSDSSGTTETFLNGLQYLSQLCKLPYNVTVSSRWTFNGSHISTKNGESNLIATVRSTPYTLTYLPTPSTIGLSAAGIAFPTKIVWPQVGEIQSILETSHFSPSRGVELNHSSSGSYPFVGVSYWIFDPDKPANCSSIQMGLHFIDYAYNYDDILRQNLYAPITNQLLVNVRNVIRRMNCDSIPIFPEYQPPGFPDLFVRTIIAVAVIFFIFAVFAGNHFIREQMHVYFGLKVAKKTEFAIVVCEVELESTLWAEIPHSMAVIHDIFQQIHTSVLSANKGKDWLNEGGYLIAAFEESHQAMQYALDLQIGLYEYEWNEYDIDIVNVYSKHGINTPENQPWNGLRVRLGMEYGPCNNPWLTNVSEGEAVRKASALAVQAHGGQILCSAAFWESIPFEDTTRAVSITWFENNSICQVLPFILKDRIFEDLRQSEDIDLFFGDDSELEVLLSVLSLKERSLVLARICSGWRVNYSGETDPVIMNESQRSLLKKIHKVMLKKIGR
eukprot:PhF_6_TR10011/c0_g1_i2/m.15286